MRIVIDMQGAQNGSRFRGIGRYTVSFVKALIRNKEQHEIVLLFSSLFPESIDEVRAAFFDESENIKIKVWEGVGPASFLEPLNEWRRNASQLLREAYIESLEPDVLIVSSMIEGAGDNSVTSVSKLCSIFTVIIFYDLIPFIYENEYLADSAVKGWYLDKIEQLKKADAWLAISESTREEGIQYLGLRGDRVENISASIGPEFRVVDIEPERLTTLYSKFGIQRPFLMYSGATDPRKNVFKLIDAYASLTKSIKDTHQLVVAGGMPEDHMYTFQEYVRTIGLRSDEVVFTDRVTDDELIALYNSCKAFIMPSLHEGFGLPALEAMACGAATIGSNITSLPEVIGNENALFDPFSVKDMADKINRVLTDEKYRNGLREFGLHQAQGFSWDKTAKQAINKLEFLETEGSIPAPTKFDPDNIVTTLIDHVASLEIGGLEVEESDRIFCASLIARLIPRDDSRPRIYVDISELHRCDHRTGIQRVVRSIASCLLTMQITSHKIELVYATEMEPYRLATRFSKKLLEQSFDDNTLDEVIDPRDGDIFLGLDFQDQIVFANKKYYEKLRRYGVSVYFVVYDLLPIKLTTNFSSEVTLNYEKWLRVVTDHDGVLCISRTVAEELREWMLSNERINRLPLDIDWFHLGADVENSVPSRGTPDDAETVLISLSERPSFLMVGTVEPRKNNAQTLAAFEQIWTDDIDVNLVIVGKQGWIVEDLIKKIRQHSELGKRLFWLEGISDEYLEKVYATSTCLIAASEGEGFGLPLIEAAQHKLPIIARDIPVFREVAGEHAFYFDGKEPDDLAESITEWLQLYAIEKYPCSDNMPWLTWKESAEQLIQIIVESDK